MEYKQCCLCKIINNKTDIICAGCGEPFKNKAIKINTMNWIRTKDRLPEVKYPKAYLVYSEKDGFVVSEFDPEHKQWMDLNHPIDGTPYVGIVTHWMPLPDAPEEE